MLKIFSLQVSFFAGNNANEIFIENGRFHGDAIAQTIALREK